MAQQIKQAIIPINVYPILRYSIKNKAINNQPRILPDLCSILPNIDATLTLFLIIKVDIAENIMKTEAIKIAIIR